MSDQIQTSTIDHTKTKARHPQTNGICERFHRTILEEFYQSAFRKKIYHSIEELQKDLDSYLYTYNYKRTHQGKMCCGRTPWETFIDGRKLWEEKDLSAQYAKGHGRAAGGPPERPLEAAINTNQFFFKEVLTEQNLQ